MTISFVVGAAAVALPLLVGVVGAATIGRGDYFLDRNVMVAWLPLAIVVAGGIGLTRTGFTGLGVISALCIAGLAIVLTVQANPSWQRDDWRLIAERLSEVSRTVLVLPAYQANPLRYYGEDFADASEAGARVREVDVVMPAGTDPGLADLPPTFHEVATARLQRWDVHRFRSPVPVRLPPQRGLVIRRDGGASQRFG